MKPTEFAQLFPEIDNPNEYLPKIIRACKKKNFPMEELQTFLHDFSLIRLNYSGYIENPGGYLQVSISNRIKKYFGNKQDNYYEFDSISDTDIIEDFDKKPLQKKLDDFSGGVEKMNLPQNQQRLVDEMIRLCQEDHLSMKDFMEEVRLAMKNFGVSPANFRKILERLRGNLSNNNDLKGMLSFNPNQAENDSLLNLIISNFEELNLKAYRFSSEEMSKMLWLKELFENNGFIIGRFPEVYLDTFERACKVFPNLKKEKRDEGTPDYLGVYIPDYTEIKCHENCEKEIVNEGLIILFEDKIAEYAERIEKVLSIGLPVIENSLKEVVLYHELGHWFSHWAEKGGENWKCGYSANDKITHESYAQIIAYWCAHGNPINELMLSDYLTQKNTPSPYNKYLSLIDFAKSDILNKLILIRKHMGCLATLSDEKAFDVLKSNIMDEIIKYAANSLRKLKLNKEDLKSVNIEILNDFIAYRFGKGIEYDYILCILHSREILDEKSKSILRFDKKFCIS
jgi:hypothetical protein